MLLPVALIDAAVAGEAETSWLAPEVKLAIWSRAMARKFNTIVRD
jgi:hypothetical protein